MERHLSSCGLKALLGARTGATKLEAATYTIVRYSEIENHPAFLDYQYRVKQMRDGLVAQLQQGSVDKWGKNHDNEIRASLYVLNSLLAYLPTLKADYDKLEKEQDKINEKKKSSTPFQFV